MKFKRFLSAAVALAISLSAAVFASGEETVSVVTEERASGAAAAHGMYEGNIATFQTASYVDGYIYFQRETGVGIAAGEPCGIYRVKAGTSNAELVSDSSNPYMCVSGDNLVTWWGNKGKIIDLTSGKETEFKCSDEYIGSVIDVTDDYVYYWAYTGGTMATDISHSLSGSVPEYAIYRYKIKDKSTKELLRAIDYSGGYVKPYISNGYLYYDDIYKKDGYVLTALKRVSLSGGSSELAFCDSTVSTLPIPIVLNDKVYTNVRAFPNYPDTSECSYYVYEHPLFTDNSDIEIELYNSYKSSGSTYSDKEYDYHITTSTKVYSAYPLLSEKYVIDYNKDEETIYKIPYDDWKGEKAEVLVSDIHIRDNGEPYYQLCGDYLMMWGKINDEYGVFTVNINTGKLNKINFMQAPANVTAVGTKICWDKVSDADSYNIYRATSKNGTYKKIGTSRATSYLDLSRKTGKAYYYKVTAVNDGEESDLSEAVQVGVSAPTSVKAVKSKTGTAKLTWKKASGAEGYEIFMATSSGGKFSKIKTITKGSTVSFKKSGLTSGKTYYFKIRSFITVNGKKVYSGYSKTVKVKV